MNHAGVLAATCCVLALVQSAQAFVAVPPHVSTLRPGGLSSLDVRQQAGSARPHGGADAGVRGSGNCRRRERHVIMGATAATRLESLTVEPISLISGEVELPGSKSLSNRVLLLSALAEGTTKVENLLDSEDIQYMLGALKTLKVSVDSDLEAKTVEVVGNAGPFEVSDPTELFLGNAGTAMRPLTAVVCAGKGEFVMDGTPRMRERPIVDLVDGLKQVGFS
ncbi:unnamed protein product [Ectocarpus fasciculatus]